MEKNRVVEISAETSVETSEQKNTIIIPEGKCCRECCGNCAYFKRDRNGDSYCDELSRWVSAGDSSCYHYVAR